MGFEKSDTESDHVFIVTEKKNEYSGYLTNGLVLISNGGNRLDVKWSGFQMPFEYRTATI